MQRDCFSWKRRSPESNCSHQLLRGIIIAPIQSWLRSYFQSIKSNVSSQVSCYITRKTNKDTILSSVSSQGKSTFIQYPSQRRTNVFEDNIHEHSWKVNNLCCIFINIDQSSIYHTPGWQKLCEGAKGLRRKVWTLTKILSPNAICRDIKICTFKNSHFWLFLAPPADPVELLWFKMASRGYFRPQKSVLSKIAFFAVFGLK